MKTIVAAEIRTRADAYSPEQVEHGASRTQGRGWSSGMRHVSAVAAKEFSDRFRSGWVLACVVVWLGAIGLTSLFGLVQIGHIGVQGYERTVISLLNLVQYFVPLLALLVGHDLIAGEREERTLPLLLSTGLTRTRLLLGKFLGACLTLAVPLALGFAIAGTAIGLAARDNGIGPFLRLAFSGLGLGLVFVGVGLMISTLCRSRVQALVIALLAWCMAIFVFDLVALGVLISTKAPVAAQEIEVACEATHINAGADLHSAFETSAKGPDAPKPRSSQASLSWLLLNPVDLFRAINLSKQTNLHVPISATAAMAAFWLAVPFGISIWKLRRLDL